MVTRIASARRPLRGSPVIRRGWCWTRKRPNATPNTAAGIAKLTHDTACAINESLSSTTKSTYIQLSALTEKRLEYQANDPDRCTAPRRTEYQVSDVGGIAGGLSMPLQVSESFGISYRHERSRAVAMLEGIASAKYQKRFVERTHRWTDAILRDRAEADKLNNSRLCQTIPRVAASSAYWSCVLCVFRGVLRPGPPR